MLQRVGYMPSPAGFKYNRLMKARRLEHQKYDDFRSRHPKMEFGHRAKLFAPFDALIGFSEMIDTTDAEAGKKLEEDKEYILLYDDCAQTNKTL